jgi:ribosome-binding factor A
MTHQRPVRVADRIREELARLLNEEVRDPGLGFVTLTGVDLSPDMRHARVFVSVLGSETEPTLEALRRATPFLRRGLARGAGLRFTPQLRFTLDPAVTSGSRVDVLLREIHGERDGEPEGGRGDEAPEGRGEPD